MVRTVLAAGLSSAPPLCLRAAGRFWNWIMNWILAGRASSACSSAGAVSESHKSLTQLFGQAASGLASGRLVGLQGLGE